MDFPIFYSSCKEGKKYLKKVFVFSFLFSFFPFVFILCVEFPWSAVSFRSPSFLNGLSSSLPRFSFLFFPASQLSAGLR
jgi:hypothetical protein